MINYIDGGDNYKILGVGINTHCFEIPKHEYDRLANMNKRDVREEVEKSLPEHIRFGYGYYGCSLRTKDDKYYLAVKIGNTCD